jgi:putative flippase GtrA
MRARRPDLASLVFSRFTKFLLAGGVAALVNLVSRWIIQHYTSFEVAVVIAFCFGVTTAYLLGRGFVFERTGRPVLEEFRRFLIINLAALVPVWGISVGLANFVFPWTGFGWHPEDVAHVIGVLAPAVVSYFGHRFYTFARHVS